MRVHICALLCVARAFVLRARWCGRRLVARYTTGHPLGLNRAELLFPCRLLPVPRYTIIVVVAE